MHPYQLAEGAVRGHRKINIKDYKIPRPPASLGANGKQGRMNIVLTWLQHN